MNKNYFVVVCLVSFLFLTTGCSDSKSKPLSENSELFSQTENFSELKSDSGKNQTAGFPGGPPKF